jgi:hypothetical protein
LYQGPSAREEVKPVVTRLVVFGAAVGSLVLLAGAVMLVLRLAQPTEYPVDRTRDPDGEMVGRVAKVEPGTILLTSEPPGSGVVPVVVAKDTRIMLGTIEGWMNDVRAGGQIKVAYDLYEGKKVARVVEVLSEQGARRPAPAAPTPAPVPQPEAPAPRPKAEPPRVALPKTVTPVPAPPTAPKPAPEAPAARPQAEPLRVAQPKATPAAPPATPAPPPIVPAPTPPPVMVAPPPPAPVAPAPAAPTPVAPASAPPGPPEPARPPEPDSTDGSAAVDWLLKGRR